MSRAKNSAASRIRRPERLDVIAWANRIPRSHDSHDVMEAYRKSNLSAIIAPEKEMVSVRTVEISEQLFEDQQLIFFPLPAAEPLQIPTVSSSQISDFLNVGRFIEIVQFDYLRMNPGSSHKKRCFDLNFLINAVTMPDGNSGPFLSVLNWFVWAFHQVKNSGSEKLKLTEFGIVLSDDSKDEVDAEQILACELLRQYLAQLTPSAKIPLSENTEQLLDRLKVMDISEWSAQDRVCLLLNAHRTLIEDTRFYNIFAERIGQTGSEIRTEELGFDAALTAKKHALKELQEQTSNGRNPEVTENEREIIAGKIQLLKNEMEDIGKDKRDALKRLKEAEKICHYITHSQPLGYDRHHNRYWYMPELTPNILVESGWASEILRRQRKGSSSTVPVVSNFVRADNLSELYYIRQDGTHRRCSQQMLSMPASLIEWRQYTPESLPRLYTALNPLGAREYRLRSKIGTLMKSVRNPVSRPQPVSVEDVMEILKSSLTRFVEELRESEFLMEELPNDWESQLEIATLSRLKSLLPVLFSRISKVVFKKEFVLYDDFWKEAVAETSSLSRLFYLCKIMESSILWASGLELEGCKMCEKPRWARKLRRCLGCGDVYHADFCMMFDGNKCSNCTVREPRETRAARNNPKISYKDTDADEGVSGASSRSEKRDENWLPGEDKESAPGKRKTRSWSSDEEAAGRIPNSRYQLRGALAAEDALYDGLA